MTINYTTLLGLAKPVTGTETGQWGDVVNNEITSLLEDAVANAATFSVTSGNVTLSTTNGSSNQARMSTLIITGTPGTTRNVIAPSQAKVYQVINQSDSSVVIKGSATTGVTIPAGATGTVVWNGSDFVEVNSTSSGRIIKGNVQITGNLQVDGNTQLGNATSDTLAVTALVNSNLLFTDNTYDLGASGATRPRNMFLSGTLSVAGAYTAGKGNIQSVLSGNRLFEVGPSSRSNVEMRIAASEGGWEMGYAATNNAGTVLGSFMLGGTSQALDFLSMRVGSTDAVIATSTSVQIQKNLVAYTDATYDIGLSGANRFRDLYLSRNATLGGSLTLSNNTVNSVVYLNGSKVASTAAGFAFDGVGLLSVATIPQAWDTSISSQVVQVGQGSLSFEGANAITTVGHYSYLVNQNNSTGWRVSQLNVIPWQYQIRNDGSGHNWRVGSTGAAGSQVTWSDLMSLNSDDGSTLTIKGSGGRGIKIVGGSSGTVRIAGDGSAYAIGIPFYNDTSYGSAMTGLWVFGAAGAYNFMSLGGSTYNTGAMYLDNNKNVGIGALPQATIPSNSRNLLVTQSNMAGFVFEHYSNGNSTTINGVNIGVGWYRNAAGSFARSNSFTKPMIFGFFDGNYTWSHSSAGSTDSVISFINTATLDQSTTSNNYGTFTLNGTTGGQIAFAQSGTNRAYIYHDASNLNFYNGTSGNTQFYTNGLLRGYFNGNGVFIVGAGAPDNYASASNPYIYLEGGRPVIIDSYSGFMSIKGGAGGWATGSYFYGSSNAFFGGFGMLGGGNSATYYWVGTAYNGTGVQLSYGGTSWSTLSDARDKQVHGTIENAIDKINAIDGVYYNFLSDAEGARQRVGFIAQAVQAVYPEAVEEVQREIDNPTEDTKRLILSYTEMIPLLLNGIKEQQILIDQLRADVAALKGL